MAADTAAGLPSPPPATPRSSLAHPPALCRRPTGVSFPAANLSGKSTSCRGLTAAPRKAVSGGGSHLSLSPSWWHRGGPAATTATTCFRWCVLQPRSERGRGEEEEGAGEGGRKFAPTLLEREREREKEQGSPSGRSACREGASPRLLPTPSMIQLSCHCGETGSRPRDRLGGRGGGGGREQPLLILTPAVTSPILEGDKCLPKRSFCAGGAPLLRVLASEQILPCLKVCSEFESSLRSLLSPTPPPPPMAPRPSIWAERKAIKSH